MTERLNHEREFAFKSCQRLRSRMFEMNTAAADWHLIIRTIGQIDNLRRYLGRETKQICSPRTFRHDPPPLPSSYRARGLVDVRAQFPAELRIDLRHVIKPAPDAPDFALAIQSGQGHVDCAP